MDVKTAVEKRISVRAFRADPVSEALVRELLDRSLRAPSGGNLQPWRVHVLTGEPLADLKAEASTVLGAGGEAPEYEVYPQNLWDPFRTRRYVCGEDLYATVGIGRDEKPARLRQLARNVEFFGAPVGVFVSLDRRLGPPQWADLGMFMQTLMLLAVEAGLDTCAQEFWARFPQTVGRRIGLGANEMLFCGLALGYRDDSHPINALRTRRDPLHTMVDFIGFGPD